jgi:hypothetical protein
VEPLPLLLLPLRLPRPFSTSSSCHPSSHDAALRGGGALLCACALGPAQSCEVMLFGVEACRCPNEFRHLLLLLFFLCSSSLLLPFLPPPPPPPPSSSSSFFFLLPLTFSSPSSSSSFFSPLLPPSFLSSCFRPVLPRGSPTPSLVRSRVIDALLPLRSRPASSLPSAVFSIKGSLLCSWCGGVPVS